MSHKVYVSASRWEGFHTHCNKYPTRSHRMFKPLPYCSRLGSRLQDHDVRYTCLAAYNLFAEDPRLLLRMFSSRRCVIEKALFFFLRSARPPGQNVGIVHFCTPEIRSIFWFHMYYINNYTNKVTCV